MPCPHLAYRRSDGNQTFDHERAYCRVTESFVAPFRADICNDVGELHHVAHCEIYRDHEAGE